MRVRAHQQAERRVHRKVDGWGGGIWNHEKGRNEQRFTDALNAEVAPQKNLGSRVGQNSGRVSPGNFA